MSGDVSGKLEVYEEVVEAGCFYCSSATSSADLEEADYEHSHCVDVCRETPDDVPLLTGDQWAQQIITTTKNLELVPQIDTVCTQVIEAVFTDLATQAGLLTSFELADFAESLVFDERSQICFAYDPRDVL